MGYDFDVCARLENSTVIPSLIFLKFFTKKYVYFDRFSKIFLESHRSLKSSTVYGQKSFFLSSMYKNFAFYCCFKKQFSQKITNWGIVSQGRGYDFDVCARLENSTVIPSLIFLKFLPKI